MFAIGFSCRLLPDDMWLLLVCKGLSIDSTFIAISSPSKSKFQAGATYFGLYLANSRSLPVRRRLVFSNHMSLEREIFPIDLHLTM